MKKEDGERDLANPANLFRTKWHGFSTLWAAIGVIAYMSDFITSISGLGLYVILPAFVLYLIGELVNPSLLWQRAQMERMQREHREQPFEQSAAERTLFEIIAHEEGDEQDTHTEPHEYRCVGHPNRTLALRYGIANLESNGRRAAPAEYIELRKVAKLSEDEDSAHYHAELPKFGNRIVRVVIQPGTDYVKTFYPMSEDWFQKHADLETILKDNPTFSLKELAMFHVQAVLSAKR